MNTLLKQRMYSYDAARKTRSAGIYPYFRQIQSDQDTEVIIDGRKVLMFGSNAYLGLTNHPKVKDAALDAIKKYGTGMAGSRFLSGTLDIHLELEQKLAKFVGKEDSIVYSTGFGTNLGVVSILTGREDYIMWDELNHASIIEGMRLSYSTKYKYRHNDMLSLEEKLQKCDADKIKLIVADGVFSMEGDIMDLPSIVKLAKIYNAAIMVDEAHSIGVHGQNYSGKGVCDHFGLTEEVDLIMGTFSKSLASVGGFIAGDNETMDYLRHNSRAYIFTASASPAATAAASMALDIIISEPERIAKLWKLTDYALTEFRNLGCEIGNTSTPIIPLFIRDNEKTFVITKMLFEEGIFVNPVVSPAVPANDTLIRFSLMSTHTKNQIDFALEKIYKVFTKLKII